MFTYVLCINVQDFQEGHTHFKLRIFYLEMTFTSKRQKEAFSESLKFRGKINLKLSKVQSVLSQERQHCYLQISRQASFKKLASQFEIVKSQFENSLSIKTYHSRKLAVQVLCLKRLLAINISKFILFVIELTVRTIGGP